MSISFSDYIHPLQFLILYTILKEALLCLSIKKSSALAGSLGRMVMEDFLMAVLRLMTSIPTLPIRNHIIKRNHSRKNILIILMKMRWYLINNSYLIFWMIPFNLYEVNWSLYGHLFYNTLSPSGYQSIINCLPPPLGERPFKFCLILSISFCPQPPLDDFFFVY